MPRLRKMEFLQMRGRRERHMTVIIFVILALIFLLIFPRILATEEAFRELTEKPFVCPNCGYRFYVRWYQLYPFKAGSVRAFGRANLKCPNCKIKDTCKKED